MNKTIWVIVITGVIVLAGCVGHRSPAAVTAAAVDVYTNTFTPTETPVNTGVPTNTFTYTYTSSNTRTFTHTYTVTSTYTNTLIPSYTFTPTATSTNIGAMPRISGYFSSSFKTTTDNVFKNFEVQLYPLGITTTTDSVTGEFIFYDVPDGNYTLSLTYPSCTMELPYGYICSGTKDVTVSGHDITGIIIGTLPMSTITPTFTSTPTSTSTPTGATITGTIHHAMNMVTYCSCSPSFGINYFECATLQPLGLSSCLGSPATGPTYYEFKNVPVGTYTVTVSSYYSEVVVVTDRGVYNMPVACDSGPMYCPTSLPTPFPTPTSTPTP